MDDIAIKAQGLGKRYRVGELKKYKALRDTLNDVLSAPFTFAGAIVRGRRRADEQPAVDGHIWAIKDISFQVKRGEVVGIVCAGATFFEGLAFGIPAEELVNFLNNRNAYLFDLSQPGNGIRYLDPPYVGGKKEAPNE